MRANEFATTADQARELGLKVGDTIQGREEFGDCWHEARITLRWLGTTHTVWIVSGRRSTSRIGGAWSPPHEATDWDLGCREWERIKTPPEHAALLATPAATALRPTVAAVRAADAAIADEALEAEFRAWWKVNAHSLNAPSHHTIYTTHFLAWGRHLLSRGDS